MSLTKKQKETIIEANKAKKMLYKEDGKKAGLGKLSGVVFKTATGKLFGSGVRNIAKEVPKKTDGLEGSLKRIAKGVGYGLGIGTLGTAAVMSSH